MIRRHTWALPVLLVAPLACGAPPAPTPPPTVSVPPALPAPAASVTPPPAPTATAAAAATPPAPPDPCALGAMVEAAQVHDPVAGSFSAPRRDEVAGEVFCNDDASSVYALLRRSGAQLEVIRAATHFDHRSSRHGCRALRASTGRDLLLCRTGAYAYGTHVQSVIVVDYARDDEHAETALVAVADSTDSCAGGPAVVADLDEVEITDLDHDGVPDVRVAVGAAKVQLPARPGCTMGLIGTGNPPKVPSPPKRRVGFLLKGETLTPTPPSVPILAELAKLPL